VLPQVLLVDDEAPEEKYRSAVRDWLRMLGVLPVFERRLPLLSTAFTVIQRNDEVVGGGSIKGQAFPLGVRVREGGAVECALPDESGAPNWMPYQGNRVKKYVTNLLDADSIRFFRFAVRKPAWTAPHRDARRSTRRSFS
jgi:hypothetical protein